MKKLLMLFVLFGAVGLTAQSVPGQTGVANTVRLSLA